MKAKVLILPLLLLGLLFGGGRGKSEPGLSVPERLHFLFIETLLRSPIHLGVREDISQSLKRGCSLSDHLVLLFLEHLEGNPRERWFFLRLLEEFAPTSPVRFPAALVCAQKSRKEGKIGEAFAFALEALRLAEAEEEKLTAFQELFTLLEEEHHHLEAVFLLQKMYRDFRDQTFLETRRALEPLLSGLSPDPLTVSARLLLAEFFLSLGFLQDTERFLNTLKEKTLPPPLDDTFWLLQARLFLRKGDLKALEKLLEGRKDTEDVLFFRGVLAQRKGMHREAIRFFDRLLGEYPKSQYLLTALQNLATSYSALKDDEQRIATLRRATMLFPQNGALLFNLFWALYQKKDKDGALEVLERLAALSEWRNQALFWKFKVTGDTAPLATILAESRLDYYYVRATEILGFSSPFVQQSPPPLGLSRDLEMHWAKYRFFSSLGLFNHAEIELLFLLRKTPRDTLLLLECARLLAQRGMYRKSLRFAFRLLPERGHIPDFAGKSYYPRFFFKEIEELTQQQNPPLDPYLVLALVHAESAFDPQAISLAGALGLTQVLPSTGAWVVEKGWVNPRKDGDITALLLEPRENLAIGMAYLAYLLRKFEGDLLLALCGYNAGPGRAERWKEELPQDRDAFIESIPFAETRNYVKKVLTNYFAYSVLYRGVSPFPGTS